MDFNDTPEENDFRLEVREWLKNNAPKEKKAGGYAHSATRSATPPLGRSVGRSVSSFYNYLLC